MDVETLYTFKYLTDAQTTAKRFLKLEWLLMFEVDHKVIHSLNN